MPTDQIILIENDSFECADATCGDNCILLGNHRVGMEIVCPLLWTICFSFYSFLSKNGRSMPLLVQISFYMTYIQIGAFFFHSLMCL